MKAELSRLRSSSGFGLSSAADSYTFRPANYPDIAALLAEANRTGRQITLRGAGRSYGDSSIGREVISIDLTRMNRILNWDPRAGVIEVECGVTLEQVWRHTLEDGYWLPVSSGTMFPTVGGALAMNIHGKNAFQAGTLGEWVREIKVMWTTGKTEVLDPTDIRFYAVISSAGLLGIILSVKLQLKKVSSGNVQVLPLSIANWNAQFAAFEEYESSADYMVSWIDCFARGTQAGRGLFHAAWHMPGAGSWEPSLSPDEQDLPDSVLGLLPKSMMWRFMKPLTNRTGVRTINAAKYSASRILGNGRMHPQSLVGFTYLLDYVPGWRRAYLPGGLIQYQSFVPKQHAPDVFAEQLRLQQSLGLESFLGVMKRHRPDQFLFSHGVDGYSLALDFKVTARNRARLWQMAHTMNQRVLAAGGRFYLAKDSTLRPNEFRESLGPSAFAAFHRLKLELDPEAILTSEQARRLLLDPRVVG